MEWNALPSYLALLYAAVIIIYSREYNVIATLKNKLFRVCLYTVLFSQILTVVSIYLVRNFRAFPEVIVSLSFNIINLSNELIVLLFLFYVIATIRQDIQQIKTVMMVATVPLVGYAVLLLTNPFTHFIYFFQETQGFTPGPGFIWLYLIPGLSIVVTLFVILIVGRQIDRTMKWVLLSFPGFAILMVAVQFLFFPGMVFTGTSSTISLLVVYLYFQNKKVVVDDLTGLQNRLAFLKVLHLNLVSKRPMELILLSLDDFKAINDQFGQLNGDRFLKSVSQFLMTFVPIKYIYRYSGDEFIILLERPANGAEKQMIQTIAKRFKQLWQADGLAGNLSASLAIVKIPEHASSVENVVSLLEHCIAESKRKGKGKIIYSDAKLAESARRRSQIIEKIKTAADNGSFVVYYQPVYSIQAGRFTSVEALLRFFDKDLGAVSPAEFIPIAEETGSSHLIFYFVLDRVCQTIRLLTSQNVDFVAISINCSMLQISQENLVTKILEIIHNNQVDPQKIRLEITESVLIDQFEKITRIMWELHQYGIAFYLDDFGTGYSNLAAVVKLPFEFIKIDKSLLYEALNNSKSLRVMKALSSTFTENGIKVVVEGVENDSQRALVDELVCDYMQGFLFARPMPGEELLAYLKKA